MAETPRWRNRIVGHGEEDPTQLLAHPENWRIHPRYQQAVLEGVLDDVGWVQSVIVNRTTGHLIDGHLRVMLAMRREEGSIPVDYVVLGLYQRHRHPGYSPVEASAKYAEV